MSTYWYLECLDHDPHLRSADEVEQHTNENLDIIGKIDRAAISERGRESVVEEYMHRTPGWSPYFIRHAVNFLADHPKCNLRLVSEYGNELSIGVPNV